MTVLRSLLLVVLRELLVNISYAMLRRCILVMARLVVGLVMEL